MLNFLAVCMAAQVLLTAVNQSEVNVITAFMADVRIFVKFIQSFG